MNISILFIERYPPRLYTTIANYLVFVRHLQFIKVKLTKSFIA